MYVPRGNPDKLVPNSARTPQQRKEQASKAGKASGVKRRQNRNIKEALKQLMSERISGGTLSDDPKVKDIMDSFGISEDDKITTLAAASIIAATIAGSAQHAKLVLDMAEGEGDESKKPSKIVISFDDNSEVTSV